MLPRAIRHVTSWKSGGLCCCVGRLKTRGEGKKKAPFGKYAALFESALRNGGGPYFCGKRLCYADVAICDSVWETLRLGCFGTYEQELAPYPHLEAWLARVEAIPELAQYWAARGSIIIPDFIDARADIRIKRIRAVKASLHTGRCHDFAGRS